MAAFDFLSNQVPLQLPNPMQGAVQGMTLARLAAAAAEDRAQAEERQRKLDEANAWSAAVPGLVQGGFSPEAVQAALSGAGRSAGAVNANVEAWRKAEAARAEQEAKARKEDAEAADKALHRAGNIADFLAQKAARGEPVTPVEYNAAKTMFKMAGVRDEVTATMPDISAQGASKDLGNWFATIGAAALDPKQRADLKRQDLLLPHEIEEKKKLAAKYGAEAEAAPVNAAANDRSSRARMVEAGTHAERLKFDKEQASGGDKLTPEGLAIAIELTRAGKTIPGGWSKTGIARGNTILNEMANDVYKRGGTPGDGSVAASQGDYKASSASLNQVSKDLSAVRPYAAMLDRNIAIVERLADKVAKTNVPLLNAPINYIAKNLGGDEDMAEYLAQVKFTQTEAGRVIQNPRLVGVLTDTARKELEDVYDGKLTLAQTKRVLERIKQDGHNRIMEMENEMERQRGVMRGGSGSGAQPTPTKSGAPPKRNAKGWPLMTDASGNMAYVGPNREVEEVK